MKLIIALGNIGSQYQSTRHNIGFAVADAFADTHGLEWTNKSKLKATISEANIAGQKVIVAKPSTYYNATGEAARAIKDFYKIDNANILVVHDDLALPFGTIRTRAEGSDAGNNGIKSIIAHLGADVARLRIGIANQQLSRYDAADFVLGTFTSEEQGALAPIIAQACHVVEDFIGGTFSATTHVHK